MEHITSLYITWCRQTTGHFKTSWLASHLGTDAKCWWPERGFLFWSCCLLHLNIKVVSKEFVWAWEALALWPWERRKELQSRAVWRFCRIEDSTAEQWIWANNWVLFKYRALFKAQRAVYLHQSWQLTLLKTKFTFYVSDWDCKHLRPGHS